MHRHGGEARWQCRQCPRTDEDRSFQALVVWITPCLDCDHSVLLKMSLVGRHMEHHWAFIGLRFFLSIQHYFLTWTDVICPGRNILQSDLYLEMTRQRVIGSLRYLWYAIFFKGAWTSSKFWCITLSLLPGQKTEKIIDLHGNPPSLSECIIMNYIMTTIILKHIRSHKRGIWWQDILKRGRVCVVLISNPGIPQDISVH